MVPSHSRNPVHSRSSAKEAADCFWIIPRKLQPSYPYFAPGPFVNLVFDCKLYYENNSYRTPYVLKHLSHNQLKMKEKGLLIYEKKEGFLDETPFSGVSGTPIEPLVQLLMLFECQYTAITINDITTKGKK